MEISAGDFLQPIATAMRSQFLTTRAAALTDVGDVAAFVASDRARTLTATDVNSSCGAIVDQEGLGPG